jgi:ribonuclease D
MPGIVDTQLMAAFTGIGDQVGLATLGNELLGLSLQKDQQWTAWERRPLTEAQLVYADADVRHLHAIYATLAARLGPRLAWVREESQQVLNEALAASSVTPETAWLSIGGARGLEAAGHAALVALAAWRHRAAVELDRPLGQVMNEKVLVELARARPTDVNAIRNHKGMSPLAKTRADAIRAALAAAATSPAVVPPARGPWRAASARAQRWAEMLLEIVQVLSEETGIAPRLLGTRADAEEFARIVDEQGLDAAEKTAAMSTWRRDVVGAAWQGWLSGTLTLGGDTSADHGIRLVPRPGSSG